VTGGLGGTQDDVTMAGVAAAFGRSMDPSDRARADLERSLAAIAEDRPGLDLEVDLEAEASIPSGSRPLINGAGLSPGCVVEATEEHGAVYVLPGIPGEMTAMFGDVAGEFAGAVRSATLYTEEPEANLNGRLDEVRERFGVQVGCYPDREAGHNRLKIRGEASDALAGAEAWLSENVETVEYTMGE
jgi:molybdopterin-biosynthesis enzyme MoeA-like protein